MHRIYPYKEVVMTEQASFGQFKIEHISQPTEEQRKAIGRRVAPIEPFPGIVDERGTPLIFGWLTPAK
jgi:hypothetical protein